MARRHGWLAALAFAACGRVGFERHGDAGALDSFTNGLPGGTQAPPFELPLPPGAVLGTDVALAGSWLLAGGPMTAVLYHHDGAAWATHAELGFPSDVLDIGASLAVLGDGTLVRFVELSGSCRARAGWMPGAIVRATSGSPMSRSVVLVRTWWSAAPMTPGRFYDLRDYYRFNDAYECDREADVEIHEGVNVAVTVAAQGDALVAHIAGVQLGYKSLDALGRAFRDAKLPAPSAVQEVVVYRDDSGAGGHQNIA